MAVSILKTASPRHGIVFADIPTIRGSMYGGSVVLYTAEQYGAILDCVLEMADAIASGNGVSVEAAIGRVTRDEKWRILPKHRKIIVDMLIKL